MDVDSAYLNGTLPDPIYMKQPYGYERGNKEHILWLKKAIYGLKQSGREWYKCLSGTFMKLGFWKSASDAAIFYRHDNWGHVTIATAVNDLMITATKQSTIGSNQRKSQRNLQDERFGWDSPVIESKDWQKLEFQDDHYLSNHIYWENNQVV